MYRELVEEKNIWTEPNRHSVKELRGKDLACWCRLCDAHSDGLPLGVKCNECAPCHADILLLISNGVDHAKEE